MFRVKKTMELSASHRISFAGGTQVEPLHGHNWKITVYCVAEELDADGMVVDFCDIEKRICGYLDHGDLNALLPFNPTTENLARWICEQIPQCYKVEVEESPGNEASYEK